MVTRGSAPPATRRTSNQTGRRRPGTSGRPGRRRISATRRPRPRSGQDAGRSGRPKEGRRAHAPRPPVVSEERILFVAAVTSAPKSWTRAGPRRELEPRGRGPRPCAYRRRRGRGALGEVDALSIKAPGGEPRSSPSWWARTAAGAFARSVPQQNFISVAVVVERDVVASSRRR